MYESCHFESVKRIENASQRVDQKSSFSFVCEPCTIIINESSINAQQDTYIARRVASWRRFKHEKRSTMSILCADTARPPLDVRWSVYWKKMVNGKRLCIHNNNHKVFHKMSTIVRSTGKYLVRLESVQLANLRHYLRKHSLPRNACLCVITKLKMQVPLVAFIFRKVETITMKTHVRLRGASHRNMRNKKDNSI